MTATHTPPHGRVIVFGASGSIGSEVVKRLAADGHTVLAVGRTLLRLEGLPAEPVILDLENIGASTSPVRSGDTVIHISYLRHTKQIVKLCPPDINKFIILGSTRYLSKQPDPISVEVRAAMHTMESVDLPWVILHPTLIYGCAMDDAVYGVGKDNGMLRIKALINRTPIIPLPKFGRALIQPIHVDDVYRAIVQAMDRPELLRANINIAGPKALSMKRFIHLIATSIGRRILIVPLPTGLMILLGNMARKLPKFPRLTELEIRNLAEDRDIDIREMTSRLGFMPRDFELT